MTAPKNFYAHSAGANGEPELLSHHLEKVSRLAAQFASAFGAADQASVAGLLHDLGKYGALFQERLKGKEQRIDHWSAGAWAALTRYKEKGVPLALAIQGHHVGLQQASESSLRDLDPTKLTHAHPLGLRLSEPSVDLLLQRFLRDDLCLPTAIAASEPPDGAPGPPQAGNMLDTRMLFSALVDADFLETEAHFDSAAEHRRRPGLPIECERDLADLREHLGRLADSSDASSAVAGLRRDLLRACLEAAGLAQGLFTLTAPTGSGKTLSMLAFALAQARKHSLRRIVVVVPYLTIIEQTVDQYRKALEPRLRSIFPEYVLEHHSLSGTRGRAEQLHLAERDDEDESKRRSRQLAENWDAPIVITTSVQFLESLFANRPAACRKLHRLAKSVILFDEVQTLPPTLAVPTLATLSHLAARYGCTVVFSTATQPAFTHLSEHVKKLSATGWQPAEIVPDGLGLFRRVRRTTVTWPGNTNTTTPWAHLVEEIATAPAGQCLCIVNLKRHALALFHELSKRGVRDIFHISTNMCPAHRQDTLAKIRNLIAQGLPCRLVSTQCVEAGVDLDFPLVYRALAPLDSIIQAAGRCNRRGQLQKGTVVVFVPEEEEYPDPAYRQATAVTKAILTTRGRERMDIDDPELSTEYYGDLYSVIRPADRKQELSEALKRGDFVEVAAQYRIINQDTINVLVPYDLPAYELLADEARQGRLNSEWVRRARPHSISLFRPKTDATIRNYLEPVPVGRNSTADDWFIYLNPEHYNYDTGLVLPASPECLIA